MDSLVSIIMPVYNASDFVTDAIESILNQTHTNWELIIVNDGSTDDSEQKIQSFCDERISYYKQENKGVSAARNLALKKMKGDFFCFLDADDLYTDYSLSSRLNVFTTDRGIDFVDGVVEVMDSELKNNVRKYVPQLKGEVTADLCELTGNSFFGPSWMFRNELSIDYFFDESLTHAEDLFFCIKYSLNKKYSFTNDVVLKYRSGHDSAMKNLLGLEQGYRQLRDKMCRLNHLSKHNIVDFKKKSKSIMFKSYLGNFKPFSALRVLFTW